MSRCVSTVLSGLAFAATIAASTTALRGQEVTGTIRGRATSVDRQPVAEVEVTAQSASLPANARTRTGNDGAYLLRGLPPGDYVITFKAAGYVPLKRTTRLSARETAAMDAELVRAPEESYEPIVAVSEGRHMFIRWPLGATTFRTPDVYELPLAGTPASLLAITPGSGMMATPTLTIWNGVPVRGSALAWTPAQTLNREALADLTLTRGTQPSDVDAPTVLAVAARRGSDRLSGALFASGGPAGVNGDALWQAGGRQAGDGTLAASFGGAFWPRHIWFFTQGETFSEKYRAPPVFGDAPRTRARGTSASGSLTFAWANRQRLEIDAVRTRHDAQNRVPDGWRLADRAGAFASDDEHRLLSAAWLTQLGRGPGLELRATEERSTSAVTDAAPDGFSIVNPWNEARLSGGFGCAACGNGVRTIRSARGVARQLLNSAGSHELTFGAEWIEDRVTAAREPGTRFEILVSRFREDAGALLPVLVPNGSAALVWYPAGASEGSTRTTSAFVADSWRAGTGFTVDAGVRWDRVRILDSGTGRIVLEEDGFSPRIGLSWQPALARGLRFSLGYSRYGASPAPLAATLFATATARVYTYTGPAINAGTVPFLSNEQVVAAVQAWAGAVAVRPPSAVLGSAVLQPRAGDLPGTEEWSAGISKQFRLLELRADVLHRRHDGRTLIEAVPGVMVTDPLTGMPVDAREIVVDDRFPQRATDIVLQGHYRLGLQAVAGGSYTHHRPAGDHVAPVHQWQAQGLGYPEYVTHTDAIGFAARHRTHAWMVVQVLTAPSTGMLSVGALFRVESSPRFGTVGWTDVTPYTANPGYAQPPAAVPYLFGLSGGSDGGGLWRLDVAVHYTKPSGLKNRAQWFFRLDILNIADQKYRLDRLRPLLAISALQDPARFAPFNPSATTPVQGVHWDVDTWSGAGARTMPRAIRWVGGFRF